ncbi:MAG: LytTR family transcriptional regulator DNA-binding domain-containing protein [Mangrovibacterium sp.]
MTTQLSDVVYVVITEQVCSMCHVDRQVKLIELTGAFRGDLKREYFIRINKYTWVNSRCINKRLIQRKIQLTDGSIHNVSRNSWKHFAAMPI